VYTVEPQKYAKFDYLNTSKRSVTELSIEKYASFDAGNLSEGAGKS
jgi:hypothetical protein